MYDIYIYATSIYVCIYVQRFFLKGLPVLSLVGDCPFERDCSSEL